MRKGRVRWSWREDGGRSMKGVCRVRRCRGRVTSPEGDAPEAWEWSGDIDGGAAEVGVMLLGINSVVVQNDGIS